ncbi:MAG TPA: PA14 domain-containing protein, partial [Flavobacteriales bacterium]|nr:PA14 domain-containing protein [Flavobacteriales bacterium]
MKKIILTILSFLFLYTNAFAGDFVKTSNGIIVRPDAPFNGNAKEVQLIVVADNIIRVTAIADKSKATGRSLMVVGNPTNTAKWTVTSAKGFVSLKTSRLMANVNLQTGAVSFSDASGKKLLAEKELGRSLTPEVFDGERLYSVRQDFTTSPDDAWYGLGQHQDDLMNHKGYQVQLFQNNTEVAVPFLVSKKNYGVLWDNYSITQVGDVRPYQSLNALKIFSKTGEQGWLTASYSNDKRNPSNVVVQRAESSINYEFLNDSKLFLPKEFKPENGLATWEGSIASALNGVHRFRFTYAGYAKVWIDGKLVLDRWRQAWNPGSANLDVDLQEGKKHAF